MSDEFARVIEPAKIPRREYLPSLIACDELKHINDPIFRCGKPFFDILEKSLIACGPGFFIQCPGFERIAPLCPFDPAWEAFEWKQKIAIERIDQLEVQIKEIQAKLHK
jgi:hypothetical protein